MSKNSRRIPSAKIFSLLCQLCILCGIFTFLAEAQVRPVYDYGAIGLAQLLKRLNNTKSVMHIGAHPDDEDSGLLAYLARGENARTAYLSLTRGDGGQNILGAELFESLGVIRTEELLQARRLDGAEQYFTRAFDFGFGKTLTEAKQKWDEKVILCDAVRAIRAFRPQVLISRFSGTAADGHGQHQFAGYISPLAVKAAADPNQCADAGATWQVLKFYVEQGFRDTKKPTLKINTGEYDFLLGRSFFEIAAEGRSQHKTQEQGAQELKGEQFSGLSLAESKAPKIENEKSVFDGIDTSVSGIPKIIGFPFFRDVSQELVVMQNSAEKALREYQPSEPEKIIPILAEGLRASRQASDKLEKIIKDGSNIAQKTNTYVKEKRRQFSEAIGRASGLQIDALADEETIAPGADFQVAVKVFFPKNQSVKVEEIALNAPNGWQVFRIAEPKNADRIWRREIADKAEYFSVKVPKDAKPTQPYWLESDRNNDLFAWQKDENQTLPFQPPLVSAEVKFEVGGTQITLNQPVEYRFADAVRGEVRRELNVVPKISLSLQKLLIIRRSAKAQTRKIVLSITNNGSSAASGAAKLNLPKALKAVPSAANFNLKNKGEKTSVAFDIQIPANFKAGDFEIGAQAATADGETFTEEMNTIAYPHIQTHRFYTRAEARVRFFDLKIAPVRVGYVTGSGDEAPEAIRQMGLTVDLLNEAVLASGDLSKYDTIVVGIRAYQVRQDLIANNRRIFDYVRAGGTLIVQYQRPDYVRQNLQPFPASMTDTQATTAGTTARVADETAKVAILEPQSPIFNFPNKITQADFSGWVQERNLYNFATFDAKYTPLLESHDAGEAENKGGMVYAKIGKGNYIYTSYSFFRQLPAGVPGAYRLFANLLSLPKAK